MCRFTGLTVGASKSLIQTNARVRMEIIKARRTINTRCRRAFIDLRLTKCAAVPGLTRALGAKPRRTKTTRRSTTALTATWSTREIENPLRLEHLTGLCYSTDQYDSRTRDRTAQYRGI